MEFSQHCVETTNKLRGTERQGEEREGKRGQQEEKTSLSSRFDGTPTSTVEATAQEETSDLRGFSHQGLVVRCE
ncbi:hypothetical protein EYF80_060373 [Liparis tanakae]|uniref:Uncharacterized protein n=1 Tax=Liparis tanakae TaxID=230148 RepID=A0A4Z2EL68_9TELE|nr:hypothetical protein EYF80_060373 [Liparis tanakae]